MKCSLKTLVVIFSIIIVSCNTQKQLTFKSKRVYKSKKLIIKQISENTFQHISFLQTNDFGNVPCNGLIVRNNNETIIFDTPTNTSTSEELINWVKKTLNCKINAIIPTHFHNDCLAGLKAFEKYNIPSYANIETIKLAKENNLSFPENGFIDSLCLKVGNEIIITKFFGEGHTKDNIIGYFPSENVMFGGCLIKTLNATKGFLGDANTVEWSNTVEKVKKAYPNVKIVVPGHGDCGNMELLDYTIKLFKAQ